MANEPSAVVKSQAKKPIEPKRQEIASALSSRYARVSAGLIGMALAVLLWVNLFTGDSLSDQRSRVASLTADQRADVAEKAHIFQALPESEQQAVREVSEYVASKSGSEQTIVEAAISDYQQWLLKLPISDYDTIMQVSSTDARQQAVEKVLKRYESKAETQADMRSFGRPPFSLEIPENRFPELTAILERAAGREPDTSRMPLIRSTEILVSVFKPDASFEENLSSIQNFFDGEICDQLIAMLPDQMGWMKDSPDRRWKTYFTARMTLENIEAERIRQLQRIQPSPDESEQFFEGLPALEQDELLALPAAQFRNELTTRLMAEKLLDSGTTLTRDQLLNLSKFSRALKDRGRSMARRPFGGGMQRSRDDRDRPPEDRFDRGPGSRGDDFRPGPPRPDDRPGGFRPGGGRPPNPPPPADENL